MEKSEIIHKIYSTLAAQNSIRVKTFDKGEIITNFIANRNYCYAILSGACTLYRYNRNGNMTILQHYMRYDCFGEIFHNVEFNSELSVVADTKTSVFYFDYYALFSDEKNKSLTPILGEMIITQTRQLNDRIEILAKKTIRERILTYFDIISKRSLLKEFELPMSYTAIASYLGVDRSAMMREIKELENDKILTRTKHRIKINKG